MSGKYLGSTRRVSQGPGWPGARQQMESVIHKTKPRDPMAGAKPCPFCKGTFLHYKDGAVACDNCQAEGPFAGHSTAVGDDKHKAEAVRLWNERS